VLASAGRLARTLGLMNPSAVRSNSSVAIMSPMPHSSPVFTTAAVIAAAIALAGCVSPQQFLSHSAAPTTASGYVGGQFVSSNAGLRTALVLVREGTTEQIVFPFSNASATKQAQTEVGVLSLPPGRYVIRSWMVYNAVFNEREFVQDIKSGPLATAFDVQPNKIVFLGRLSTQTTWTPGFSSSSTRSNIGIQRLSQEDARAALAAAYPRFADLEFSCVLCTR
jgi:hypothetical protein